MLDILVGVYGWAEDMDARVATFLSSLRANCNLENVNVFCVERACRPVSECIKNAISQGGFQLWSCPLLPFDTCREDVSQFCDWMVNNLGEAPWVCVSHFDLVFKGDYIGYMKALMLETDMIGNHHNGIVAISRDAYRQCQVGFCGLDKLRINASGNIIPGDFPGASGGYAASFDVGELLAMRICTLGLRHVWLSRGNEYGKSDLFVHTRRGSAHGGARVGDSDT